MMTWFGTWIGWMRFVAFIGLMFGLIIRIADPSPVAGIRNATFDIYHQSKPRTYQPLPVAIIDLDDRSIEELGQWPWPRTRMAEMVDRAMQDGAVAVAFDIVFSEPDRLSPGQIAGDNPNLPANIRTFLRSLPDNDRIFADSVRRGRVILGQTSVRTAAGNRADKAAITPSAFALLGDDPRPFLWRFPDIVQNLPLLEQAAAGRGMFTSRPDRDGVYRRTPLVMLVQDEIRLGLAPELLRVATGGEPFAIRTNEAGVEGVILARQLVQTAQDGTVWPYLTHSNPARYVSAGDLLGGRMPQGRLAGHLVLVGTSAIGLEDFRATPLGIAMAGVEIHAQVLENILAKTLLVRPNYTIAVELVVTFLLCAIVIIFAPGLSAAAMIGASVILLGGYIGFSYYLFYFQRILLDPSYPLLATATALILISMVNYLREERKRREIRSAFGQYVSPDLVNQLSENETKLTLGGQTRELTLLFSDVRGFTAIAEDFKDDPEALTALMNQFLTILSNPIMDSHGTIDKFMGDAVMAFWNAPLNTPDHELAACRAALRMIADIEALNAMRMMAAKAKGRRGRSKLPVGKSGKVHRINVGIGINTGPCVVGNMGSDTRFDYTALGDPVNVASRLESQSRYYGVPIILGSTTANRVRQRLATIDIDTVRVVGKALPENISALLGDEKMAARPEFQKARAINAEMLSAYRARDWDRAEAARAQLPDLFQALELPLAVYLDIYRDRISDLRVSPPDDDWDGVFAFSKK